MNPIVLGLLMLCAQLVLCTADMQCSYYDVATRATFDLSLLRQNPQAPWRVQDKRDARVANYTYLFDVCAPADTRNPDEGCVAYSESAAFQVRNSDQHCYALNNAPTNVTWGLIDPADPTKGVTMQYNGGSISSTCGQRGLQVSFACSDAYVNTPISRVVETSGCHFQLTFETIYGCPIECSRTNRLLCSGHGVCGYDNDLGAPRCFCDGSHSGVDCSLPAVEESHSASCDGVCAALIVLVILLTALLLVSCVIFYRVQKLETLQIKFSSDASAGNAGAAERAGING